VKQLIVQPRINEGDQLVKPIKNLLNLEELKYMKEFRINNEDLRRLEDIDRWAFELSGIRPAFYSAFDRRIHVIPTP